VDNTAACMQEGQRSSLWTFAITDRCCSEPPTFSRRRHMFVHGVLKRHNFRVHVSPGSAETLVRRGGIINHHSIAYSLSNISAKNYRNRLMWVESIVCNISVGFSETQCSYTNRARWVSKYITFVASILQHMSAKNYENWLTCEDKMGHFWDNMYYQQ